MWVVVPLLDSFATVATGNMYICCRQMMPNINEEGPTSTPRITNFPSYIALVTKKPINIGNSLSVQDIRELYIGISLNHN